MPLNHFVTLGRSGLRVSPLCLGTMTFGEDWGWGSSPQDAAAILHRYFELGGNFLDTANVYTKGHSEAIIGDAVGRSPHLRQKTVIATKFFGSLYAGDPNAGGSGRKAIFSACEHSLRRLKTDYIDLYWMHCWDKHTPIEETMRALDDLVRAGKVRYLGLSDTPAWKVAEAQMLARFEGWSPLIALQIEYSLLQRTVEGELVPMAQAHGLGVTPWSPLKGGALSGKYTRSNASTPKGGRAERVLPGLDERAFAVIETVVRIAKEVDSTPARVALAWVQQQPGVTSSIIGARTLEQLNDTVKALELTLRPEDHTALADVSRPALNFPAEFIAAAGSFSSGGCTINGETYPSLPLQPKTDAERY